MKDGGFREKEYYKEKTIEMIEKMENQNYLFKIYHYILAKYRRWEAREAED